MSADEAISFFNNGQLPKRVIGYNPVSMGFVWCQEGVECEQDSVLISVALDDLVNISYFINDNLYVKCIKYNQCFFMQFLRGQDFILSNLHLYSHIECIGNLIPSENEELLIKAEEKAQKQNKFKAGDFVKKRNASNLYDLFQVLGYKGSKEVICRKMGFLSEQVDCIMNEKELEFYIE